VDFCGKIRYHARMSKDISELDLEQFGVISQEAFDEARAAAIAAGSEVDHQHHRLAVIDGFKHIQSVYDHVCGTQRIWQNNVDEKAETTRL
jgi:hypothetical protein